MAVDGVSRRRSFSLIMPVLNEVETIERTLKRSLSVNYPTAKLEILVIDGGSTDGTRDVIERFAAERPVTLIFEGGGSIPESVNVGFDKMSGDLGLQVNGHSYPDPDFFSVVNRTFDEHENLGAVGPRMVPVADTPRQRAIGYALKSPLGATSDRFTAHAGDTDTVNFGIYPKEVVDEVGGMRTDLKRAEDYEFNRRIRDHGYRIYQNPQARMYYYPRESFRGLASQSYGNARWKATVLAESHGPYALQMLVAATVAACGGALVMGLTFPPLFLGYGLAGLGYLGAIVATAGQTLSQVGGKRKSLPAVVLALLVLHAMWVIGVLSAGVNPVDKPLRPPI